MMKRSSGATYSNWLLACDRWLATQTQGVVMGTFALAVSGYDWLAGYEADQLPSDAVAECLAEVMA